MKIKKDTQRIGFFCACCKEHSTKTARYMIRRYRQGKMLMFCSRKCTDNHHSNTMSGKNNPNYKGKFHGECPSTWSEEKRAIAAAKISATFKREGTVTGENNPRWRGGSVIHECVICRTESEFSPHISRAILEGSRSPTCSNECASALGRRGMKNSKTSIEIKTAKALDSVGVEYVEQYNLGDKFRLDFYLPESNIVIECDGDYWHNLPEVARRDKSKNAYIKACGMNLFRFWEHEINANVTQCVRTVLDFISKNKEKASSN